MTRLETSRENAMQTNHDREPISNSEIGEYSIADVEIGVWLTYLIGDIKRELELKAIPTLWCGSSSRAKNFMRKLGREVNQFFDEVK